MKYQRPFAGLVTTLLATLLALAACAKNEAGDSKIPDEKVATVNGKPINKAVFEFFATSVARRPVQELTDAQREQVLDQMINMQLAADLAEKGGIAKGSDLDTQLQLTRLNVLMEATVKKYADQHVPTDAEIKAEYEAQVAGMGRQYHARHILVESKAAADDVIQKLKAGADFAKLAEKESSDGSAKQGGDLNWFSLNSMAKPFADAVAALDKGKYTTTPVQTQFGWHVIKLEDIRSPAPPAFEEVKDRVKGLVQQKKIIAYLDDLRKTAKIEKTPAPKADAAAASKSSAPAEKK